MVNFSIKLNEPIYLHREVKNDFGPLPEKNLWLANGQRVAIAALPFISQYKPLGFLISTALNGLRCYTSISHLNTTLSKENAYHLLQSSISLLSFAAAVVGHPLGMFVTTSHDLLIEMNHLITHWKTGEKTKAMESCLSIMNNSLYLGLMYSGKTEMAIVSLVTQILSGGIKGFLELKEGKDIEGGGHLLMACFYSFQLHEQYQKYQHLQELAQKTESIKTKKPKTPTGPLLVRVKRPKTPKTPTDLPSKNEKVETEKPDLKEPVKPAPSNTPVKEEPNPVVSKPMTEKMGAESAATLISAQKKLGDCHRVVNPCINPPIITPPPPPPPTPQQLLELGIRHDSEAEIQAAVKLGADVNLVGSYTGSFWTDATALGCAYRNRATIAFRTLLELGANPNTRNLLQDAYSYVGHYSPEFSDYAADLVRAGVDITQDKNVFVYDRFNHYELIFKSELKNPMDVAIQCFDRSRLGNPQPCINLANAAIGRGINIHSSDKQHNIFYAIFVKSVIGDSSFFTTLNFAKEKGANINQTIELGEKLTTTPLILAVLQPLTTPEVIQKMIDDGANVNQTANPFPDAWKEGGYTPLECASKRAQLQDLFWKERQWSVEERRRKPKFDLQDVLKRNGAVI